MNKIILKGRLGNDPETNGSAVKFSVATDDGYKKADGEKVEKTNWHSVVAFGKLGETIAKYVTKGQEILIEGRVEYRKHDEKYYTDVIADSFEFCGSKN